MLHIYFYTSSNPDDEVSQITIVSSSPKKAFGLALLHFLNKRYKGAPVRIAL